MIQHYLHNTVTMHLGDIDNRRRQSRNPDVFRRGQERCQLQQVCWVEFRLIRLNVDDAIDVTRKSVCSCPRNPISTRRCPRRHQRLPTELLNSLFNLQAIRSHIDRSNIRLLRHLVRVLNQRPTSAAQQELAR